MTLRTKFICSIHWQILALAMPSASSCVHLFIRVRSCRITADGACCMAKLLDDIPNATLGDRNHFEAFNGIRNFSAERGYKVIYLGTRQTFSEETEPELPFGMRDVDGLIYMISDIPSQRFVRTVQKFHLPIVMTDWFDP